MVVWIDIYFLSLLGIFTLMVYYQDRVIRQVLTLKDPKFVNKYN